MVVKPILLDLDSMSTPRKERPNSSSTRNGGNLPVTPMVERTLLSDFRSNAKQRNKSDGCSPSTKRCLSHKEFSSGSQNLIRFEQIGGADAPVLALISFRSSINIVEAISNWSQFKQLQVSMWHKPH
ncbi:hypothetical protein GIB67_002796 [Kingdonia uniflora]|uniref:Uncharacterized protein n=1 Tax=Kingdonia uniflora TaxID=39325 RepID=A0A7J7LXU7_9MAGN|nr:hypothetical protein GIB67_002796 [Kingdonia uniflora]